MKLKLRQHERKECLTVYFFEVADAKQEDKRERGVIIDKNFKIPWKKS